MNDKQDAIDRIRESLAACEAETGLGTLEIRCVGGGPTNSGRTDYYDVRVWKTFGGRPLPADWLTFSVAKALGCRFNEKREAISMQGCGFSKSLEIAQRLAKIAGHPITYVCPGDGAIHTVGVAKP